MTRLRSILLAPALAFTAGAGVMWAQQQAQNSTRREPQFENDHLRVWKSIILPKQPLALHRHEHGRALIALVGGQVDVVDQDGKVVNSYQWDSGKAYWLGVDPPGQMHADVNNSSQPIEVIVVELKNDR
jgi:hypothetical protein